jgi:N-acetylglucosaminyldiphosphoundecaprenol N-acetyl-beta-D-mannosaminyltransferase
MLVGASPDFAVGLAKRAPRWMQRLGVEWLHRLAGDPRRLAKRYLVDDVAFVRLVWREWRARR